MQAIAAQRGRTDPVWWTVDGPPAPSEEQVLCRTLELGICGTDRDILQSAAPLVPPGCDYLILGHECLGEVLQVGGRVKGFQVGDLVVPVVRRPREPGAAPLAGRADLMPWGTYTERGIVEEHGFSIPRWLDRPQYLFRVPASIEDVAVLTEPLSVAEKGVNEAARLQAARLGVAAWEQRSPRVLVTGMGPIGFAAILACQARDWPVTLCGRDPEDSYRARLAVELGARYVPQSRLNWQPSNVERDGFDLILECTGSEEVMLRSAPVLASCGILVWLGSQRQGRPGQHNVAALMRIGLLRNHLHLGSVNAAPRDFRDALQHLVSCRARWGEALGRLITARVAPAESRTHFQRRQPQGIKTVLMYR